jgi:hypothetical protein
MPVATEPTERKQSRSLLWLVPVGLLVLLLGLVGVAPVFRWTFKIGPVWFAGAVSRHSPLEQGITDARLYPTSPPKGCLRLGSWHWFWGSQGELP